MTIPQIRDAVAEHADEMDGDSRLNRLLFGRHRKRLFGTATGRTLDVACGTGTNHQYVPDSAEYTGVDISSEMLATAESRHPELERGDSLREMDAHGLAFPDDSFDTVITSLTTCMFPEPTVALQEMARVCKPDGRVLLLEHGRSSVTPIARFQDRRADARYEQMGCRWNQEPEQVVQNSPLSIESTSRALLGIITAIEARPPETLGAQ